MNRIRRTRALVASVLLLALLAAPGLALAGTPDQAWNAIKEYQSLAPTDDDGLALLTQAWGCLALALTLRMNPGSTDLATFQNKCGKFAGLALTDPDAAEDKGLLALLGGIVSAINELLKKP